jgi:hypothetical protein
MAMLFWLDYYRKIDQPKMIKKITMRLRRNKL